MPGRGPWRASTAVTGGLQPDEVRPIASVPPGVREPPGDAGFTRRAPRRILGERRTACKEHPPSPDVKGAGDALDMLDRGGRSAGLRLRRRRSRRRSGGHPAWREARRPPSAALGPVRVPADRTRRPPHLLRRVAGAVEWPHVWQSSRGPARRAGPRSRPGARGPARGARGPGRRAMVGMAAASRLPMFPLSSVLFPHGVHAPARVRAVVPDHGAGLPGGDCALRCRC